MDCQQLITLHHLPLVALTVVAQQLPVDVNRSTHTHSCNTAINTRECIIHTPTQNLLLTCSSPRPAFRWGRSHWAVLAGPLLPACSPDWSGDRGQGSYKQWRSRTFQWKNPALQHWGNLPFRFRTRGSSRRSSLHLSEWQWNNPSVGKSSMY